MQVCYRLAFDPRQGELRVQLAVTQLAPGASTLLTPAGPAAPAIAGARAGTATGVRALDPASGDAVYLRQHGWGCYTVAQPGDALTVSYIVAASGADDTCGLALDARHLLVAAHDGPCVVHYEVPAGWTLRHPGSARALGGNAWEYASYAQLLATQASLSRLDPATRDVHGATLHIGFPAPSAPGDDEQRFADSLAAIAGCYHDVFGAFPFTSYTCAPPRLDDAALRACARALFLAWDAKGQRPQRTFSPTPWLAQGFAHYYERLACARAGLDTAADFFRAVRRGCAGMTVAFALDAALRLDSGGSRSLDSALAEFHAAYAGQGLEQAIQALCACFGQRLQGPELHDPHARSDALARMQALGFKLEEWQEEDLRWDGTPQQAALIAHWLHVPLGLGVEQDEDMRRAATAA